MSGDFAQRALELFRAGHRVVPIPPGGKRPTHPGWPNWADTQDEAQVVELQRTANGAGVGILAKFTAGVDVDVRDYELTQRLGGLVETVVGPSVQRIGQAPKLLIPYRVEVPFHKVTSHEFRLPGDGPDDKPHRLEILGDGQQWVAYAVHPATGNPYHWPDGDLPAWEDLPELTEALAHYLIERVEAAIIAHGGTLVLPKVNLHGAGASGGGNPSPYGQAGTIEALTSALRVLPNDDLEYDAWIEVGLALKGGLGEAGLPLWHTFSAQSSKDDPAVTRNMWRGFKPHTIGAGTLYGMARRCGWKPGPEIALNPDKAAARARARDTEPTPAENTATLDEADNRPVIRMVLGRLDQTVAEANRALAAHSRRTFVLGDVLSTIETVGGRTITRPASPTRIGLELARVARFEKIIKMTDAGPECRDCDPPMKLANAIADEPGGWRSPALKGLTEVPILRPDGSVVTRRGYDPLSQLYLHGGPFAPLMEDPEKALALLRSAIEEFPFLSEAHRSAALAMQITGVVRRHLATAPMFGISAAEAGTGKGLLAQTTAITAIGRRAAETAWPTLEEEQRKKITGDLLSGKSMILLDNISAPLDSAPLCVLLTAETWSDRRLGVNEDLVLPASPTVIATGNNLVLVGDLVRRTLPIHMDAGVESPELRTFKRNLLQWATKNRPRLVSAALSIVAAHRRAGSPLPTGFIPLGSFEEWSKTVCGALIWLDQPDPRDTMKAAREADPKRQLLRTVLTSMHTLFGSSEDSWQTTGSILDAAKLPTNRTSGLLEAIEEITVRARDDKSTKIMLGKWLLSQKERVADGLRLQARPNKAKNTGEWRAIPWL